MKINYRYHPPVTENFTKTRTLEICEEEGGWYFTVHQDGVLIFQSQETKDRVKVTIEGMKYLDALNRIDEECRCQQKGQNSG